MRPSRGWAGARLGPDRSWGCLDRGEVETERSYDGSGGQEWADALAVGSGVLPVAGLP